MSSNLTDWDKLLPNLPRNNEYFTGPSDAYPKALYELILKSSGIEHPSRTFNLAQSDLFTLPEMASNVVSLRFLGLLIQLMGARRVLEIGAFIGLSTMTMARLLPPGGQVVSIEKFERFAAVCRTNFAANGLEDRIQLIVGNADDEIGKLPPDQPFDLVFIDGNKENYAEYFQRLSPLVRIGGLIIVDDALFHGDVLNATPSNEKGHGTLRFLNLAAASTNYHRLLLPISNGMMLMRKTA